MSRKNYARAVLLISFTFLTATAGAAPPDYTWLNQFAGFPEQVLRNAEPTGTGFVGSTGLRRVPMRFRAPDGSVECHVLIRYDNGQWTTTGDIGPATPGSDNCGSLSGSAPVLDVTPFRTSICIGGEFTNLGPDNLNYFACYNAAGQWQQIGGPGNGPNAPVQALAFDGNNVYLGGSFTSVNNATGTPTSARRIVRTDGINWDPLETDTVGTSDGVNGTVSAVLPTTSFVYAAVGTSLRRWSSGANDKWMDLGSSNTSATIRDIELNAGLIAASSSGATMWGGRAAGAVSEYSGGSMEWSAVGSSAGISTGFSKLAVANGFFHSTGDFTSIDPDARGVARLTALMEWEAVPDSAALGDSPEFLDLLQVGSNLCGVQQGVGINQQFFSRGIACNDGTRWRGLAQGIAGGVFDLIEYDGAVIAGGQIAAAGDSFVNFLAEYRDGVWGPLGGGLVFTNATPSAPGDVRAMAEYDGDLYVMGLFDQADGASAPGLARWNGQDWAAVGQGINSPGNTMLTWNNQLIMVGTTPAGDGPILSWDGTTLSEFPDLPGFRTPSAMAVYNGELIAAYRPSSAAGLARWTGTAWEAFGEPSVVFGGDITAMIVRDNSLYVGGTLIGRRSGQIFAEQVALWDGSNWSGLGDGLQGGFLGVNDLAFADDAIVATGSFENSGGTLTRQLAYYDGQEWFSLGAGLYGDVIGSVGRSLLLAGSTMYVGGTFEQAGDYWAENIAAFNLRLEGIFKNGFE